MASSLRWIITATWLVVALAVLPGCGGGSGSHTYIITPSASPNVPSRGIYITIISPVAFPASFVEHAKNRLVAHTAGPQVCSYAKQIHGLAGQYAYLNGKTLTLKVSGSNPLVVSFCAALKTSTFNPAGIGG